MLPLKTYHGPVHSLFIKMVIVCVVLFQWQYQSLCLAMGFGLWVSCVNFGVSGCCNVEQLASHYHHPAHFKGVAVFHKSGIWLCLSTLIIMSPHSLVAFTDPFQLSLIPEIALAEPIGNSYSLLVLLLNSLHSHFVSAWAFNTVSGSCGHIRVGLILPWWVWVRWNLISSTPWASCHSTVIRISSSSGWTGRGLVGSYPCCWIKLGLASSTNSGMSSLPCAELCSLLALTSWGVNTGPLVVMIAKWGTRRAVQLFLCGNSKGDIQ